MVWVIVLQSLFVVLFFKLAVTCLLGHHLLVYHFSLELVENQREKHFAALFHHGAEVDQS